MTAQSIQYCLHAVHRVHKVEHKRKLCRNICPLFSQNLTCLRLKSKSITVSTNFVFQDFTKTHFRTAENICRKILYNIGSSVRHFWASSYNKGSVAEWSKALVLGTSPKGRGFESHRCQKHFSSFFLTFFIWKSFINSQEKSEIVNLRKMNFVYIYQLYERTYIVHMPCICYVIVTWCTKTWRINYSFILHTTTTK